MVHLQSTRSALVYLIVAILLATYPLFFGRFYAIGDMYDVFLPLEDFFHRQMLLGQLPSWHPDIAWGFPVIASAQIGFFYPPLLLLRLLPVPVYLPLAILVHLVALAVGTYLVARREDISVPGALLSALSMTLGSFVFQHLTHLNIILTLAWLPWQLLAMKRLSTTATLRNRALAAITIGLPFLAGNLHVPFLLALISVTYYLTSARQQIMRRIGTILPLLIVAVALAAVQLAPTLELLRYSSRGEGGDFAIERANQLSWPIYHLPAVIFPRFFGLDDTYWGKRLEVEYGIFIGTIPLLLAFFPLRATWRRHRFFTVAAIIGFLLALGDMSPFRLFGFEPSLWYFSAPARWLLLYTFAASILAGAGFDYLCANRQKLRRGALALLIVLTLGITLYNLVVWMAPADTPERLTAYLSNHHLLGQRPLSYYEEKFTSLMISVRGSGVSLRSPSTWLPLLLLSALAAAAYTRRLPWIMLGLTAAELILISATTTPTIPWPTILATPPTVSALPVSVQTRQARIFSVPPAGDTGLFLTNPDSRPGAALRERHRALLLPGSHARFSIAGSTWPASLDLQSHNEALANLSREELNIGATLTDTNTTGSDTGVAILPLMPQPRAALVSSTEVHSLPYPTDNPTRLTWTVDTLEAAELIVRDTFYPGWRATIDGQPAAIQSYKNIFRRLEVPRGQHTIIMNYAPTSLAWGLTISGAATLLLLGLLSVPPLYHRMRR